MLRRTYLFIGLAILILLPISVDAQGDAYIGPHLGIQKASDADDSNYLVGASLRLKLIPFIAAEGAISYRQEDYAGEAVTVKNWPVTVTGLIYPLPIVYGGVGAGWYNTDFDYSDALNDMGIEDHSEQEFGWHLAAGAELPASSNVHLYADVRYVFLDYEFADLPDVVEEEVDSDFYSIKIGLLFAL